jgi:hypothetical protein
MSFLSEYTLAMDYVREKYGYSPTTSMYELVVRVVGELQQLEAKLQKLEKSCQKKPKQKAQSKSKK